MDNYDNLIITNNSGTQPTKYIVTIPVVIHSIYADGSYIHYGDEFGDNSTICICDDINNDYLNSLYNEYVCNIVFDTNTVSSNLEKYQVTLLGTGLNEILSLSVSSLVMILSVIYL